MKKPSITHDELLAIITYDALTGQFNNKKQRSPRALAGESCGWINALGYRAMTINKEYHLANRLAWFYMTGQWPDVEIDHLNGIRSDNRFGNLRPATREINMQNRRKARSDSASGVIGAHWHRKSGKWASRISVGQKGRYLGLFDSAQEASAAYIKAKRELHAGCTI